MALLCSACVGWAGPQATGAKAPSDTQPATKSNTARYALIFGTVWDSENRPVYGVHVQLHRSGEKKVRWEAYSDHRGEFAFHVPPGKADYDLVADEKSIKALKNNNLTHAEPVKIHVEMDERVDTGLHLMK